MLIDITLLKNWQGLSAGQVTQVLTEVAEVLIKDGTAKKEEIIVKTKQETKKSGK